MSKTVKLKIVRVDIGFCQITYSARNPDNQRIFYCLQDHYGIRLLRCTQEYEPNYEVKFFIPTEFEIPKGDSELEGMCREWIKINSKGLPV